MCHPKTPIPIALPLVAERTVFSINLMFLALSINSCNVPSRNQHVSSGKVIPFSNLKSFHSSQRTKFSEDKQHIKECNSSVYNEISLQMLVIETCKLFFLYATRFTLLMLSSNIMYGSPVSRRVFKISPHNLDARSSLFSNLVINVSSITTH